MKFLGRLTWLHWLLSLAFGLIAAGLIGVSLGYSSGVFQREKDLAFSITEDIQTQFELGLQDYAAGNYELAEQRFEYILEQNPNYPGVIDMLVETHLQTSKSLIQATESNIPTSTAEVPTPVPTPDTRAVDELFQAAQGQLQNQDWTSLSQTIVSLRDIDPTYKVIEVDRMLFLALHFSGMDKILNKGNLEGGLYDLALVEKFAPLDKQARIYQEWARLYVIGASFWGVFPDKSVYYFSQLANAAPYLKDLSGIYAIDRYRLALIQYGDQLSKTEEWCLAVEQYDLAFTLGEDQGLLPTATYVADLCQFGTTTPTIENLDPTSTLSLFSPTPGAFLTSTPIPTTPTVTMDVTLTPTLGSTPTPTIEPETPMPTPTESPIPSTPTPTSTPETSP